MRADAGDHVRKRGVKQQTVARVGDNVPRTAPFIGGNELDILKAVGVERGAKLLDPGRPAGIEGRFVVGAGEVAGQAVVSLSALDEIHNVIAHVLRAIITVANPARGARSEEHTSELQ